MQLKGRHFQLTSGGGRLKALWIGPAPDQAPTLVFLHEGLGCVRLWRDAPSRLSELTGCGALVYSRLGYGGSDPCPLPRPIDFMHHEALTVLPDILGQAGIRDHILIGHSDGGSIALIHAGGDPRPGLLGLVTLAAHVFCEDLTRQSIRSAKESYLNGDLKHRLEKYHGENTDIAFWGWNDVWLHPDFLGWNIESFLPGIRVPLLAVQGEDDPYGTAAQIEAIRARSGGDVTVEMVSGCGHAPHMEQPEMVAPLITDFVLSQTKASARHRE